MGSRTKTVTLWSFLQARELLEKDLDNRLGPYIERGNEVHRHLTCPNYDACLSYAAKNRWPSFGCRGCRKTQHGSFNEE